MSRAQHPGAVIVVGLVLMLECFGLFGYLGGTPDPDDFCHGYAICR